MPDNHTHIIDISEPFCDVVETPGVGDVIHQHDAHGSAIVGRCDGVKPLLAGCVPTEMNKPTVK